jgi:hypothetical protein
MEKKSIQNDETYNSCDYTMTIDTEVNANLKFSVFYLILVMIVFVANLVYYNTPSYNPNNIIEDTKLMNFNFQTNSTFSYYKVVSRNTKKNSNYE